MRFMFNLNLTFSSWILVIISAILILAFIVLIIYAIKKNCFSKDPSFNSTMNAFKSIQLSLLINLEEDKVEKYYIYDANNKSQIITFDEFCYSFDNNNVNRLKEWLNNIDDNFEYGGSKRIELVMLDENNKKRLYRFSLQNYLKESRKYFILANDITESSSVIQRYEKVYSSYDLEKFFDKINDYRRIHEIKYPDCIVSFSFKEYEEIIRDFKGDSLKLLDYAILAKIEKFKEDDDIICQYKEGTFLMYSPQIEDLKYFKKRLKKLLNNCSGVINTVKSRFNLTFVCGVSILKEDSIITRKIIESSLAAKQALKKSFINDKVVFFNAELSKIQDEKVQKLQIVRKIIEEDLFSLTFTPIINKDWKVVGYNLDIICDSFPNISRNEIFDGAQEMGIRKILFTKLFNTICDFITSKSMIFFLNFEYQHLGRLYETYISSPEYKKINCVFCLEFNNFDNKNITYRSIEKMMGQVRKNSNIKFAISSNKSQRNYLTETIYNRSDYLLLRGKLVNDSLETYYNKSNLEIQSRIANQYKLKLVGLDIKNIAQLEFLYNLDTLYFSGPLFTSKILKGQVNDNQLLKQLIDLKQTNENR